MKHLYVLWLLMVIPAPLCAKDLELSSMSRALPINNAKVDPLKKGTNFYLYFSIVRMAGTKEKESFPFPTLRLDNAAQLIPDPVAPGVVPSLLPGDKLLRRFSSEINSKTKHYASLIQRSSDKALKRLEKQERRMYLRLAKQDKLKADSIFSNTLSSLHHIASDRIPSFTGGYNSTLDSLNTTFKYLGVTAPQQQIQQLQDQLKQAAYVQQYIRNHKARLKEELAKYTGFTKDFQKLSKTVYYYNAQLSEYKSALKDPQKATKKALSLLKRSAAYNDFIKKNALLSQLFNAPSPAVGGLDGLQTREQVQRTITERGGVNISDQLNNAQESLSNLQLPGVKLPAGNESDLVMPDFKPNMQHTRSFLQRLEADYNIQTQRSTNYLPSVSDIGLSVGYRLNDKSLIGIGVAYKLAWGKPFKEIRLSHEGVSLRSFMDVKLRKSIWISGGMEYNYIHTNIGLGIWQRSGLLGLTQKIKTAKLQLLWDAFSYQQHPKAPPLKFRIGYHFR